MTLEFRISDIVNEIDAFLGISEDFIEQPHPLHTLQGQLSAAVQAQEGSRFRWEIPDSGPLRTRVSRGSYEPGEREGGDEVLASITSIWELRVLEFISKARNGRERRVALNGLASTRVEIRRLDAGLEEAIACWKVEVGDDASPGCHFHHQLGDGPGLPFPGDFPVPRLPSLFVTPVAVVEFVLGELFQNEWAANVSKDRYQLQSWRAIQSDRLLRLLDWQKGVVAAATSGSPWSALKAAKPDADLVLKA